jgi:hypothetical protein
MSLQVFTHRNTGCGRPASTGDQGEGYFQDFNGWKRTPWIFTL